MTDQNSSANPIMQNITRAHFEDARRREWLAALRDALSRSPHELLALEEVRNRLQIRGQRHLGQMTVPLDKIIGSEGDTAISTATFCRGATMCASAG